MKTLFTILFVYILLYACGVGITTGPYLTYEETLSEKDELAVETYLTLKACPSVEKKTHRDCDIHNDMHKVTMTWVDGDITVEAEFEP